MYSSLLIPDRRQMAGVLELPSKSPCTIFIKPWAPKLNRWGLGMPIWVSLVVEEHLATRKAAGCVRHSRIWAYYQVDGYDAASYLNSVCANWISRAICRENHFIPTSSTRTPDVIDDTLVYRRAGDKFLMVVNASNTTNGPGWKPCGMVKSGSTTCRPGARTLGYEGRDP